MTNDIGGKGRNIYFTDALWRRHQLEWALNIGVAIGLALVLVGNVSKQSPDAVSMLAAVFVILSFRKLCQLHQSIAFLR